MAYDYDELFVQIDKRLSAQPAMRLYELARQLECSHPTVERAVTKHTSLSFRQYQKGKLLDKAVHLLRQGYRAREIGPAIGYKWPENFMRFVKKSTGHSLSTLHHQPSYNESPEQREPQNPNVD
jgi:AraC-like DNA-binding protein